MLKTASVDLSRSNFLIALSALISDVTCHYRRETYTAASVCLADVIFILFLAYYAYIAM
jgi:hypothetical protein